MNITFNYHHNERLELLIISYFFQLDKKPSEFNLGQDHFYFDHFKKLALFRENGFGMAQLFDDSIRARLGVKDEIVWKVLEDIPSTATILTDIGALKSLEKRNRLLSDHFQEIKTLNDPLSEIDLSDENFDSYILNAHDLSESVPLKWKSMKPLKTRFQDLSQRMYSFNKGEVCGVIGRSGVGKTAFGYQFCEAIAEATNEDFLFWSGEMDDGSLLKRIALINFYRENPKSSYAESARWFFSNVKNDPDFALRHIPRNMVLIEKNLIWSDLKRLFTLACKKNPRIGIIGLDYLQLVKTANKDRRVEVGAIAKDLKALAKELNIRFVPLIQTTRDGADGFEPVKINHCKESGEIEEALDIAVGLWKDKDDTDSILNVAVIKSRNDGGEGEFKMSKHGVYFTDKLTQFEDIGRK